MKIFNANMSLKVVKAYHNLFPEKKINVLRSYGNLDKDMHDFAERYRNVIGDLCFDSGTWTLNYASANVASKISLYGFKRYLERYGSKFDFYFNFDSDFSTNGFPTNWANQCILEQAGLNPVPVVHDIFGDEIPFYISKGYDFIALGSKQVTSMGNLAVAMDKFGKADSLVKVHLFGNSKFEYLANFPLYSCDTASWAHTGSFGFINYWNPHRRGLNKTDKIYMEEYIDVRKKHKFLFTTYQFRQDLEQFLWDTLNVTYDDLLGPDGAFYKQLVNTHYYVQLEEIVNGIHRQKGFIK